MKRAVTISDLSALRRQCKRLRLLSDMRLDSMDTAMSIEQYRNSHWLCVDSSYLSCATQVSCVQSTLRANEALLACWHRIADRHKQPLHLTFQCNRHRHGAVVRCVDRNGIHAMMLPPPMGVARRLICGYRQGRAGKNTAVLSKDNLMAMFHSFGGKVKYDLSHMDGMWLMPPHFEDKHGINVLARRGNRRFKAHWKVNIARQTAHAWRIGLYAVYLMTEMVKGNNLYCAICDDMMIVKDKASDTVQYMAMRVTKDNVGKAMYVAG